MRHSGYRVHDWGTEPQWESFELPEPGPGEVLIEVEACGVGLTVLNCINGDLSDDTSLLPRVPGHELVGRVVEPGPDTDDSLVGRRVVAYFYLSCGRCEPCRTGREPHCRDLAGWVGVHRDGGYAQFAVLPLFNVIQVPDELDPIAATVVPDAVATPVHVSDRAGIGPDDRVAVFGAGGGVGAHMIQVAATRGAVVAGLDIGPAKLAEIERLGARPVNSEDLDAVEPGIFEGDRPTVVIDLVGNDEIVRWSLSALDMGGRLVMLTTFRDQVSSFTSREMVFGELAVLGSRYSTRSQVKEAADLVARGEVQPVIGSVTEPGSVLELHRALREGRLLGRGAVDWRQEVA